MQTAKLVKTLASFGLFSANCCKIGRHSWYSSFMKNFVASLPKTASSSVTDWREKVSSVLGTSFCSSSMRDTSLFSSIFEQKIEVPEKKQFVYFFFLVFFKVVNILFEYVFQHVISKSKFKIMMNKSILLVSKLRTVCQKNFKCLKII